ncbi:NAD(P)/FAD-dependent oxidoreductase, partial [Candidatus Kaiserbacteria bacterium]|nr:NAD(P)/FAD-dependent oxidoreductase [Candidatus Kaiserbacteria bacterium]
KITIFQNDTKQESRVGNILFTHVGLSGPGILNMSSLIGELLEYGEVHLEIDTLPSLDYAALNTRLQEVFKEHHVKKIRNSLSTLIPSALVPVAIELAQIDPDTPCHSVTRTQRLALEKILKHLPVQVDSLLGLDKAIITSGGVKREEVDFKTCASRLYDNLYLVGDILDIDRPSGGYSLQLCWTTGQVAGSSAAQASKSTSPKS